MLQDPAGTCDGSREERPVGGRGDTAQRPAAVGWSLSCALCLVSDAHFWGVSWMGLFRASLLPDGRGEEAVGVWEEHGPPPRLSSGRGSWRGNGYAILKGEGFQEMRRPRPGGVARRRTLGLFPPSKGNGLQPALPQGLRGNSARFLSPLLLYPILDSVLVGQRQAGRAAPTHTRAAFPTTQIHFHAYSPFSTCSSPLQRGCSQCLPKSSCGLLRPVSNCMSFSRLGQGAHY